MSLIDHLNDSVRGTPLASEQSMKPLELSDKFAVYLHCALSSQRVAWIRDNAPDPEILFMKTA
jgi:hypothetical protein